MHSYYRYYLGSLLGLQGLPVRVVLLMHRASTLPVANPQKTVLFLLRMCYGTHNMLRIYYHFADCIELRA